MASHQSVCRLHHRTTAEGPAKSAAKTMFGEYGLYCDGQFFAVICEDQLFLKCTPQGEATFPHLPKAPPYPGARDSLLVEDVEDQALLVRLTQITCAALADQPKKARRKQPMPIDYKKTQKEFYRPSKTPHLIQVPPLSFLAVQGQGRPQPARGRLPGGHRPAVCRGLHPEDEQAGPLAAGRLF